MTTDSTRNALIARLGLLPLAGTTHVTDAQIRQALAAEDYAALQPQRAAERRARLQAEREREERGRRRFERIRAANEAVDEYMRTSGTRNYQAAFNHIQHTRPELFAEVQVPAHEAVAENFNPNHDRLGRFTTSDGAVAPHGREHRSDFGAPSVRINAIGQPQATPASTGSIAGYGFDSNNFSTCVPASIRSLIATKNRTRNVPDDQSIIAQLVAASKGVFTRSDEFVSAAGGVSATPAHYMAIVQKVLANNGVQTTSQLKYGSAKELAAAVIASRKPAMINIQRAGTTDGHSVVVQWLPDAAGPGQGRFLINNVTTTGETHPFTKEQLEQGQITVNIKRRDST